MGMPPPVQRQESHDNFDNGSYPQIFAKPPSQHEESKQDKDPDVWEPPTPLKKKAPSKNWGQ